MAFPNTFCGFHDQSLSLSLLILSHNKMDLLYSQARIWIWLWDVLVLWTLGPWILGTLGPLDLRTLGLETFWPLPSSTTSSYFLLPLTSLVWFGMVKYGGRGWLLRSHVKIFQCYFTQKSFMVGDIAIIATSSRSRSLIWDLRLTLDLDPSLTISVFPYLCSQ